MPDETTNPGQQNPPAQQIDWEARYRGQSTVINNLTAEKSNLQQQVATLTAEVEQLKAQLALKGTEMTSALTTKDLALSEISTAKAALENEIANLRSMKLAVDTAKKIGHPELAELAGTFPGVQDENTMETMLKAVAGVVENKVKARETQLTQGITPPVGTGSAPSMPTTLEDWQKYISGFPFGSAERENARRLMQEWGRSQ